MALSNILREFLIRIAYAEDDASKKKFVEGIKGVTEVVVGLGAAIEATAASFIYGIAKMSDSLEKFYFISQRTGSSVANIRALGFAASQMGLGLGSAEAALEGIAGFLRSSPMAGGLLKQLGINPGQDPEKIFEQLSNAFAKMPVWMAKAYADVLGIDENTMLAMRRGMGQYLDDYRKILKIVGVDEDKAAAGAHKFMVQLRTTTALMKTFSDYVLQLVGERASKDIQDFTNVVEKNFTRIADITASVIVWVLNAADAVTRLAVRGIEGLSDLYDGFMKLPAVVRYVLEGIAALEIAFAAFDWPVLLVGALAAALIGLYDDYKTWKEGGRHLIDWDRWKADLDLFKDYMMILPNLIEGPWNAMRDWFKVFWTDMGSYVKDFIENAIPGLHGLRVAASYIPGSWIRGAQDMMSSAGSGIGGWLSGLGGMGADPGAIVPDPGSPYAAPPAGNGASGGGSSGAAGGGSTSNNWGNLRNPGGKGFQSFSTPEGGLVAMRDQLRRYAGRGLDNIDKIISTWAPPSENNTAGYIGNVSRWTGFGAEDHLDLNDPVTMGKLMYAISRQEGHGIPSQDMLARVAGINGGGGAQITQANTYNIHGGDPHATAEAVKVAQDTSNSRLIRNLQPVAN